MCNNNKDQNLEHLDDERIGNVAGGFIIGDKYLAKTYNSTGIKVIKHTWSGILL